MENTSANKLIKEIQDSIQKEFKPEYVVESLKKLREFALQEQNPVVVKSIRLAYEQIENNNTFISEIPNDEPIDEENQNFGSTAEESLDYFLSLLLDISNKHNIADLREYNRILQNN